MLILSINYGKFGLIVKSHVYGMIKHIVSWLFSKIVSEKGDIMSEKRRERKNRVLRNGESQRKDGIYMYKYNDANGEVKYFYSWRLDKNDSTPVGKKYELSLRKK